LKPKLIVYSDYICPFCYIGKRRVDRLKEEIDVDVDWRSFELRPGTPEEGIPRERKTVSDSVKRLAEEVELDFKPRSTISNSKLSFKTGEFTKTKDKFEEYHEAVFKAYFQEGKNIGDINVIEEIIAEIGLDKKEFGDYLKSNIAGEILEKHKREAMEEGIYAVPTFIVGNKMIIGAQPYETLKEIVVEVE
jgi:predicted DsbA family dithiol-disulfide isomerase